MPSAQKVAWSKLRVGIMAIFSMIILGALIFLLTGDTKLFSHQDLVYTYMDDAASIVKSAPVRLNGILAGKIDSVTLSGEKTRTRIVKIQMLIDREMMDQIPEDSVASISAENVLGTKFINIKKGTSTRTIKAGAVLKALDTQGFEEVVQSGYALLTSLQGILTRVDKIVGLVESGSGSIGKLLINEELYNRILAVVAEGQKVTHAMTTDKGTLGKLLYDDDLYQDVRGSVGRVNTLLDDLQQGKGTAGKLLKDDALYADLRTTLAELRTTVADLNAGKGTAGKLLKSDEMHNQLMASLGKIDSMIDRLNSGQGTVGQLLVNPQLYDTMNGATRELHELFKDFRANPKKFLRVKVSLF